MADSPEPGSTLAHREDSEALDAQCEREWHPIYGFIYRAVRHAPEAQDLTQEVFLRAAPKWRGAGDGSGSFRAYLVVVARNLLRDRWKRRRLMLVGLDEASDMPAPVAEEVERAEGETPGRLWRAFLALPADYQRILRLRIVEERPMPEVAALLGRRPDAVRQLQHRAIVALRQRLDEEG